MNQLDLKVFLHTLIDPVFFFSNKQRADLAALIKINYEHIFNSDYEVSHPTTGRLLVHPQEIVRKRLLHIALQSVLRNSGDTAVIWD